MIVGSNPITPARLLTANLTKISFGEIYKSNLFWACSRTAEATALEAEIWRFKSSQAHMGLYQPGRLLELESRGQRFKSSIPYHMEALLQVVALDRYLIQQNV